MDKKVSTIAKRLQDGLNIRHMTAAELSRKSDVKEAYISHYRHGDYEPASKNIEKLANALHVSIPWLMGYDVDIDEQEDNNSDEDIDQFRQRMRDQYGVLFDMYDGASPEDRKKIKKNRCAVMRKFASMTNF